MVYNNAGNNYNNYVAIDYPQPAQYYELMRSSAAGAAISWEAGSQHRGTRLQGVNRWRYKLYQVAATHYT